MLVLGTKNHQHEDETGQVFGSPHPISGIHKNPKTKEAHNRTVEKDFREHRSEFYLLKIYEKPLQK